jgi:hypothetical protein
MSATREALPALLGGMEANAQDPAGPSRSRAIQAHDSGRRASGRARRRLGGLLGGGRR